MTPVIAALKMQVESLKGFNQMMKDGWGTFTNQPGFMMAESTFMKNLLGTEYICPFSAPFNGGAKPFLMDMYIAMNEEIIKDLERKIENEQNNLPKV